MGAESLAECVRRQRERNDAHAAAERIDEISPRIETLKLDIVRCARLAARSEARSRTQSEHYVARLMRDARELESLEHVRDRAEAGRAGGAT